jgi:predicted transcriptional regulator/FixJ family two-component response regulator
MNERDLVKQVRVFASSELRMNILLILKNGAGDINDLQRELGGRNTTILHAIRDMLDSDLITKDRQGYRLTNLGKIKTSVLDNVMRVFENLETYPDLWLNHDISSIPPEFLDRLGMLFQSEIISPDPSTPLKCHEKLVSMLAKSKKICAILPVMAFPKDSGIFLSPVRKGSRVDLLITDNVVVSHFDEEGALSQGMRQALKFENFKLRLSSRDIKLVLIVTESFVSMGLWRNDGVYDVGSGTIYTGDCAVSWGLQLFEYYFGTSSDVGEADMMDIYSSSRRLPIDDGRSDAKRESVPEEAETVILVEDNVGHAAFIRRLFEGEDPRWNFHHVVNLRDALKWIEDNEGRSFLVIADYLLPDGCGLDLARDAESPREVGFPLIILTGFGSEKIAAQAFKSGAMDYVVKDAESMQKLPESARKALRKWGEYKKDDLKKEKKQDLATPNPAK